MKITYTGRQVELAPAQLKKLEEQGIAIKIMIGDEYDKYFAETHAKAKKYTEWAKNRPM